MIRRHHQALRQMVSVNREDSHWSPRLTSILGSLSSFPQSFLSHFLPPHTQLFISLFLHLFQSIFSRSLTHPSFYSPLCSLSICSAVFYSLALSFCDLAVELMSSGFEKSTEATGDCCSWALSTSCSSAGSYIFLMGWGLSFSTFTYIFIQKLYFPAGALKWKRACTRRPRCGLMNLLARL